MQSQPDCDEFEVAKETLDVARVIESQNVTFDSQGVPSLSKGVAKDRRISVEDPDIAILNHYQDYDTIICNT